MKPKDGPCHDCKDRFLGCHSECKEYLEWVKEVRIYKDKIKSEKKAYYISVGHNIDMMYENRKKKHKK